MDKFQQVVAKVDGYIAQYPSVTQYEKLKELEEKTGHSKVYFFVGALFTILSLIYVTGGMKLASDLVGFLYPAYMSFKALEGGKTVDGDATQWMTYWVIFSSMMLLESTFPILTRTVSFFHVVKIGIIIWLYHPQTSGAQVIYGSVVRPNIQKFIGAKKVE